jgi:dTDP-4-dehydrorhamnose reductase
MTIDNTKILVLGASGMLGNTVLRMLSQIDGNTVTGTVRSRQAIGLFPEKVRNLVVCGIDADDLDSLMRLFDEVRPDIVINCTGLVKQLTDVNNPLVALPINSLFPHRLAHMCALSSARLVHMSTDCVFTGNKGMYTEDDVPDANDLYGVSKRLGEVDYSNAVTLRTSIIGHELNGSRSLVDWFLAQDIAIRGYRQAIFSGLPTIELARVISEFVIPCVQMRGVYHVSSDPISKYDLLSLVAKIYKKKIEINEDNDFVIDRSLDSTRFREETGYSPPSWESLITSMYEFG